jgi:hypothetical protein
MHALFAIAVEHSSDEGSKTAFYVAAGLWACWAVALGAIGITRPAFPRGEGGGRVVMLVSGVLMVAVMATAVITAS